MKKEELQERLVNLEKENGEFHEKDERIRKNLSQFLGFRDNNLRSFYEDTNKTLSWSEIYFELGKLKSREERLVKVSDIQAKIEYLMEQDRVCKENSEKQKDCRKEKF